MTLPAPIAYGTVKAKLVTFVVDTADADALPNQVPVSGSVRFVPSASVLLAGGASPATVITAAQTYTLDAEGVLRDGQGRADITLVATDSAASPTGWTWTAHFLLGGGLVRAPFSFALPAGTTVDLTTVAPLPASNGTAITRGEPGPPGPPGPKGSRATDAAATAGAAVLTDIPAAPLTIPTPDGGGQLTHPSVFFDPEGWNGHRYWLAATPYDGSTVTLENPCIWHSDDGDTWTVPAGLTNPIEPALTGGGYNSDPHLTLGPDQRLYCFWRTYDGSQAGAEERIYYRASADGVDWTDRQTVQLNSAAVRRLASPAVVYDRGVWHMWSVSFLPATNVVVHQTAAAPTGPWSEPVTVTGLAAKTGHDLWHLDVHRIGGEFVMLFAESTLGGTDGGTLGRAVSRDGLAWTQDVEPFLMPTRGAWNGTLYRSCLIPARVRGADGYEVFAASAFPTWRVGRTVARLTDTRPRQDDPVNLTAAVGLYPGWLLGDVVNRANSTTSPGTTSSGQPWVVDTGTVGVIDKALYLPAGGNARAVIDLGTADYEIGCTLKAATATDQQFLIGRFVDGSNYIRAGVRSGWVIETIIGGAVTVLVNVPNSFRPVTAGQRLRLVCKGSTITLLVDGHRIATATVTAGQTATKVGIQAQNTTVRFTALYARTA